MSRDQTVPVVETSVLTFVVAGQEALEALRDRVERELGPESRRDEPRHALKDMWVGCWFLPDRMWAAESAALAARGEFALGSRVRVRDYCDLRLFRPDEPPHDIAIELIAIRVGHILDTLTRRGVVPIVPPPPEVTQGFPADRALLGWATDALRLSGTTEHKLAGVLSRRREGSTWWMTADHPIGAIGCDPHGVRWHRRRLASLRGAVGTTDFYPLTFTGRTRTNLLARELVGAYMARGCGLWRPAESKEPVEAFTGVEGMRRAQQQIEEQVITPMLAAQHLDGRRFWATTDTRRGGRRPVFVHVSPQLGSVLVDCTNHTPRTVRRHAPGAAFTVMRSYAAPTLEQPDRNLDSREELPMDTVGNQLLAYEIDLAPSFIGPWTPVPDDVPRGILDTAHFVRAQ